MKKLMFLIFLPVVVLLSCDGRDRAYKSNAEILSDSNLLESFSKQIKNIPNESVEIYIDTILSNGFQVKLKYNSIEGDFISVVKETKHDSVIYTNHKNFEAKFQVLKQGEIISEYLLNKHIFSKFDKSTFLKNAVMQFVWIDYDSSTKDYINLNTSFRIPETESYKDFSIKIDSFGNMEIKEINLVSQVL